jgi:signal transduction histidine kinase
MPATEWLRRNALEVGWFAFVGANVAAMALWPSWETIPFHLIWTSLTLLYGLRVWGLAPTFGVLLWICTVTGILILHDAFSGSQTWGELFEVPLMSTMFLAMVWHARRRQEAVRVASEQAREKAALLAKEEQFLNDVSHELRTPVTIARGHLEILQRSGAGAPEIRVALDELERIERIVSGLLVLARAGQPNVADTMTDLDLEPFLEDVVMRWAEVAPRVWRVGDLAQGALRADPDALRIALDALVENAVDQTGPSDAIEVRSRCIGRSVAIEVVDEGPGMPADALGGIFHRFARLDRDGKHNGGGVGLGLAIVDAIAKAHGGRCTVSSSAAGSTFAIVLPRFRPAPAVVALPAQPAATRA